MHPCNLSVLSYTGHKQLITEPLMAFEINFTPDQRLRKTSFLPFFCKPMGMHEIEFICHQLQTLCIFLFSHIKRHHQRISLPQTGTFSLLSKKHQKMPVYLQEVPSLWQIRMVFKHPEMCVYFLSTNFYRACKCKQYPNYLIRNGTSIQTTFLHQWSLNKVTIQNKIMSLTSSNLSKKSIDLIQITSI